MAAGRVAGERDPRTGVRAEVAEDHGTDVDGRAQVAGDALLAAVELGPVGVPRVEDGLYGQVHLLARVLREVASGVARDDLLELLDQLLQVGRVEIHVDGDALGLLRGLQRLLEEVAVDAEDGLAEHLDEAAVRVPRELLVAGLGGEADDGLVGEADVENRVHHAGHRELRAGADGDQQRVVGLTELLAHLLLEGVEVRTDLVAKRPRLLAAVEVDLARLGGDGEARRDGQPEVGHLGEVGALPAEQVLQILVALGEVINELLTLELRGGYVGIFVFRHGSRLLEDAGGCPDGQEHTQIEGAWVRPLARHTALTTRPPADRKLRTLPLPGRRHSTLELIITQSIRFRRDSARWVVDASIDQSKVEWHRVPSFEKCSPQNPAHLSNEGLRGGENHAAPGAQMSSSGHPESYTWSQDDRTRRVKREQRAPIARHGTPHRRVRLQLAPEPRSDEQLWGRGTRCRMPETRKGPAGVE